MFSVFFARAGLLFAATVLYIAPAAAEGTLTLVQAQRLALARSLQLAGLESSATASREMAVAAGQLPDPVLKLGVDNLPASGPDRFSLNNDFMTMRRIGIAQELTRADKRHWRAESLARAADKTVAEKALAAAAIERDTALAWLDRYYAEQIVKAVADGRAQAAREADAADSAYRAGRGSQADVLTARSALALADDRASDAERRLRSAAAMLARWVGKDAEQPLAGAPAIDTIPLDAAGLGRQPAHHPRLAVLDRQEEIALAEAKLAEAGKKVDWSVEVALQQRGSAYSNMISVGLSVPLQWGRKNRQDRELSAKLALLDQARAEREEAQRSHVAEVRVLADEWRTGRERIARYERELLPLAGERTLAVLAAYRGGKAALGDVLAARRNETELRLQALQLANDTARIWTQLSYLAPHEAIKESK